MGKSLLDELSDTETPTGGEVDDARKGILFEEDDENVTHRKKDVWGEEE